MDVTRDLDEEMLHKSSSQLKYWEQRKIPSTVACLYFRHTPKYRKVGCKFPFTDH